MSRGRFTEQDKAGLLAQFERSGSTAAAFCRKKGLAYQTFLNWRRTRGAVAVGHGAQGAEAEFEEVELPASDPRPRRVPGDPAVELILAGGSVLRIYPAPLRRS